ncbi:MAG: LysR family transcriptional regulator [Peptococcaceae bacterium]|nr:LysR family transcriptional regulator [Peptococcaceae bacterium]
MNVEQALLLIDLAQTHSFNQTAERFFVTQQSVSYKIKQLETELQTKIFIRSNSGVQFTPEGNSVLQCAREMNQSYQTLLGKLALKDQAETVSNIVFSVASVLLSAKMTRIIHGFNSKCTGKKLVLREVSEEGLMRDLENSQCDVAFWSVNKGLFERARATLKIAGMQCKTIIEDQAVAVVSRQSALAEVELLSIEDISNTAKSIFGVTPMDYFGREIGSHILYENANLDIHKQLIRDEHVICFTSRLLYENYFTEDAYLAKDFEYPTLPIAHMMIKREGQENPSYQTLEALIEKALLK